MNEATYYCIDCKTSHPIGTGEQNCRACQHIVCRIQYFDKHYPEDMHHVVQILDDLVNRSAEAAQLVLEWIEDDSPNTPILSEQAKVFLERAQSLLVEQQQQMQRLRDEVQAFRLAQKVG